MAREKKRLVLTRVGEREISEDTIISFPRGLIGFEEHREFVLLPVADDSPFLLLQSLEDPRLGFLVADPYPFLENYQVQIDTPQRQLLKLTGDGQSAVLVTVTIPQNEPEKAKLNLSGPIILNTELRIGLQVPQVDTDYPSHLLLTGQK